MSRQNKSSPITVILLLLVACEVSGAEQDTGFFERKIRPVLVKHCYGCHSAKAKNLKGGLRLDTRETSRKGGDSGPAIVPGKPAASLLLKAIAYGDPSLQMPPNARLPATVVADFRQWIAKGAVDPRQGSTRATPPGFDLAARKSQHWAWHFKPSRTKTSIDTIIRRRLLKAGLRPSPPASAPVIIRRLTFDLTGLPPTPAQIRGFQQSWTSNRRRATTNLVDRLLNSPQFGEHWARHWLDVVRFCETKGHVTDQERPHAWKYRDYVISALNKDVPYNKFVLEHLAGDLLPPLMHRKGPQGETNVAPTATGFLFMHEMHFMSVDPVRQRWDEINAQIDVIGKAFLGLTIECARCHDHKFDAISQRDYYALAGFFYSTEQGRARTAERDRHRAQNRRVARLETRYRNYLKRKRQARRRAQTPKASGVYFPVSEELGVQSPRDTRVLTSQMEALRRADPSWSFWVRSARDVKGQDVRLLIRGEHRRPGDSVARRFLAAIDRRVPAKEDLGSGSGRMWLARQIISNQNPLTARVWVNRLWHHIFGRGIVATPNNFGALGARPSHPKLLDYLASRLLQQNWSTKRVIREIVLSQTYLQSSQTRADVARVDPENILLARQNRRRLTAEQLRDAMLAAAGTLNSKLYGPSVDCYVPPYATANKPGNVPRSGPLTGNHRRSIYLKVRKNFYDPFLVTFNFPDRGASVGRRAVTLNPGQALAMLNSPLVHEVAKDWSRRLIATSDSLPARLDHIWLTALGRKMLAREQEAMMKLIQSLQTDSDQQTLWKDVAHVVFNHADFAWID